MAFTYTYQDLLAMISPHVPRGVLDLEAANVVNLTNHEVFARYDFRSTLKTLPPFFLIPNQQDFGPPFLDLPSDFFGLRKATYVNLTSSPPIRNPPLKIVRDLQLTNIRGTPNSICYNPDTATFRVFPRVPPNIGCPYYLIDGTYKKRPTKITPATLNSTLPLEDDYLEIYREGMLYAAMHLARDPRAGEINYQGGHSQVTGQLAKFYNTMDRFAAQESIELGDQFISPSEPLVSQGYGFGVFGNYGPLF